ncbi:MAG: DUF58 domain-containing protein [Chitinophagales bacterium]
MFSSLYLKARFFLVIAILVVLFLFAYSLPFLFFFAKAAVFISILAIIIDFSLLFRTKKGIFAVRSLPDKFSNGDQNPVFISLENRYPFVTTLEIIDELPFQFQLRNVLFKEKLDIHQQKNIQYELRPVERGEYHFGKLNIFCASPLGLLQKRYQFSESKMVAVYPSFIQMRQYELMAISNRLKEFGLKKIRRIGHSMEFEQIRNYNIGDDYRTLNWKATARRGELMVNQFQDEKSQQIYSLIDKGRVMKMPFEEMTLLDYAINASLVISNIAIKKGDKSGLLTFSKTVEQHLPAYKRGSQMRKLQELLYQQTTDFLESEYERLYAHVHRKITQRSLLLLFTNFETLSGLNRQIDYLRQLNKRHLLVVVFFENTELKQLLEQKASETTVIYQKTIAEKLAFEKRQIIKELQRHGIQSILTAPQHLTINTINKYLELKARGFI